MRLAVTVFLLCVTYAVCYPSFVADLSDSDENDENSESYEMSKRQGGHNIIDRQSKCEIACIATERNPEKGKPKTIKEAAKVCRNVCKAPAKKQTNDKKKPTKLPKRALVDFLLASENDDEQQERREFLDFLTEQFQQDEDEE